MDTYHTPTSSADIVKRFAGHPEFQVLGHAIDSAIPPSREKALALTQLEQSMHWTDAAIARAN